MISISFQILPQIFFFNLELDYLTVTHKYAEI